MIRNEKREMEFYFVSKNVFMKQNSFREKDMITVEKVKIHCFCFMFIFFLLHLSFGFFLSIWNMGFIILHMNIHCT